jgi:hypothetical protein
VPGEQRVFRRKASGSGQLRVSLHPPLEDVGLNDDAVVERLRHLVMGLDMDVGQELTATQCASPLGPTATSIWQSPSRGLHQFWLIAARITVFASFTMESLDSVKDDLADAQRIIDSIRLTDAGN